MGVLAWSTDPICLAGELKSKWRVTGGRSCVGAWNSCRLTWWKSSVDLRRLLLFTLCAPPICLHLCWHSLHLAAHSSCSCNLTKASTAAAAAAAATLATPATSTTRAVMYVSASAIRPRLQAKDLLLNFKMFAFGHVGSIKVNIVAQMIPCMSNYPRTGQGYQLAYNG